MFVSDRSILAIPGHIHLHFETDKVTERHNVLRDETKLKNWLMTRQFLNRCRVTLQLIDSSPLTKTRNWPNNILPFRVCKDNS